MIHDVLGALNDANIRPDAIGYINTHATSTPVGDAVEVNAIKTVFKNNKDNVNGAFQPHVPPKLYISSTKGATGHLLGAAGAVETIFTAWSIHTGIMPPTLHLSEVDPLLDGALYDIISIHIMLLYII